MKNALIIILGTVLMLGLCNETEAQRRGGNQGKIIKKKRGSAARKKNAERANNYRGEIQFGGAYFIESLGYQANVNLTYLQSNKLYLETSVGYGQTEKNGVTVNRIPIMIGAKYKLQQVKNLIYFYAGADFVGTLQKVNNIIPTEEPPSTLFGVNGFAEIVFNMPYKLNVGFRYNHQMVFNDKVSVLENGRPVETPLILTNYGFVLRKTF